MVEVRHVERYGPRRSARYALGGLVAGGVLGALGGALWASHDAAQCRRQTPSNDLCGLAGIAIPFSTLGGAVVGTVVGALVKVPGWETLF